MRLELKNIYFKFIDSKYIFKNFSCSFYKINLILSRRKSGSGKSTLLDLIMGFYDP